MKVKPRTIKFWVYYCTYLRQDYIMKHQDLMQVIELVKLNIELAVSSNGTALIVGTEVLTEEQLAAFDHFYDQEMSKAL